MSGAGSREAPALRVERGGQGLYIVPDHINVSGGVTVFGAQTVRIKRSADLDAGLGRYPLNQPVIADIFEKNRRYFQGPDFRDDTRYIARAGRGIGRNAKRRDEFDVVSFGKIAEGAVGGDHPAVRRGYLRNRRPDVAIELVELRQIAVRISAENRG